MINLKVIKAAERFKNNRLTKAKFFVEKNIDIIGSGQKNNEISFFSVDALTDEDILDVAECGHPVDAVLIITPEEWEAHVAFLKSIRRGPDPEERRYTREELAEKYAELGWELPDYSKKQSMTKEWLEETIEDFYSSSPEEQEEVMSVIDDFIEQAKENDNEI